MKLGISPHLCSLRGRVEAQTKPSTVGSGAGHKGKGASLASMPCKYFRSGAGRKAGKNCKWSHSWDGVDDKNSRCWICGGKDHCKSDCKLKGQQSKGSSGKDGKSAHNLGQVQGEESRLPWLRRKLALLALLDLRPAPRYRRLLQELDATVDSRNSGQPGETAMGEVSAKGGGGTGSTSETLLQDSTKLLKSLRAPQLRVTKVSQLDYDNSSFMILLDSGATHAFRLAESEVEWDEASPTQVSLADGVTAKLQLRPDSKILLSSPHDAVSSQSWIAPMGGVTDLGYKFEWRWASCYAAWLSYGGQRSWQVIDCQAGASSSQPGDEGNVGEGVVCRFFHRSWLGDDARVYRASAHG